MYLYPGGGDFCLAGLCFGSCTCKRLLLMCVDLYPSPTAPEMQVENRCLVVETFGFTKHKNLLSFSREAVLVAVQL